MSFCDTTYDKQKSELLKSLWRKEPKGWTHPSLPKQYFTHEEALVLNQKLRFSR